MDLVHEDIHEKTGLPEVDMRVKEATDECSFTAVLEPKTCELQAGQLILQETTSDSKLQGCQLHGDTGTGNADSTSNNDCILPPSTSKTSSSERDSDWCTDKAVIEVSAELVFCCKEDRDHVIKDICVDEGLPSKKNIFVQNTTTDKEAHLVHFVVDKDTDISVKDVSSIMDDFPVDSGGKLGDHSVQFVLPDSESIYDDDLDKSLIGGWPGRIKYIAYEKLLAKQSSEVVTTSQSFVATVADSGIEQRKDNQVKTQEETADAAEDSNCKSAKETASSISGNTSSKLPEPQTIQGKEEKAIGFMDGHHDSHTLLEHGLKHDGSEGYTASSKSSMCTLDGVSASKSRNPSTNTEDLSGNLCHALAECGTEYVDSAGLGASSQGSFCGLNETNGSETRKLNTDHVDMSGNMYPGTDPVSATIAYSGPIAYSGSISLRSDSSTTSTRSFAFPILSSDWNTSPVKMAAADPMRLRKHKGWRMALWCCRF